MSRAFYSPPAAPSDRGFAFGQAHTREITATIELYKRLFDATAGEPVEIGQYGVKALESIGAFAPALAAEITGIAAGAELPVEEVAAVNARTEILAAAGVLNRGECSAAVELSRDRPVAIQTWDWHDDFADSWLVWTIEHPDGRIVHTLTEYGIVGKIGVSSARLGLLLNILHHERDGEQIGVPIHILARRVLDDAGDINDALMLIAAADVGASSALTVIACDESDQTAVTAEVYPGGPGYVLPNGDGLLVHTNHFVSAPAAQGDREPTVGPDSYFRYEILSRQLRDEPSAEAILSTLASHLGGGGAVCCHPTASAPFGTRWATLATIALDVSANTLTVLDGGPCGAADGFWISTSTPNA